MKLPRLYTKENVSRIFCSDYSVLNYSDIGVEFVNSLTNNKVSIPCSSEKREILKNYLENGVEEAELIEFMKKIGNEDYYYLLVQKGVIG